ncbi:tripartite tricarboxylate transporter permease [Paracoccus sp. J55]|uniref:tripartite tricarboxylate transporter permease n=1 Tax=Paracoccus sp. J55 TaxID=935849 RepID=UPI00048BC152|nr:tripartite tricarboxylate transporter permease [Paracoccus sp. J55]
MDLLNNLAIGLGTALSPHNVMLAFLGCIIGTLIGILPGLGPLAAMAMLLPLTYYFPPESALIMLAGIYYGAQYGGSTTAILVNLPGESSAAVTCIDGHQMALKGRAGSALAIAALGSFFAGTVATLVVALLAAPLSALALLFRPQDYFALMVFGLVGAVMISSGSTLKSLGMVLLGILLGMIGIDINSGNPRFTLGIPDLLDGLDFVPLAIGLFGLADILWNLMRDEGKPQIISTPLRELWPTREEFGQAWPAAIRGTAIGSILGVLPGGGALLASFASYAAEKRLSKTPERFGRGAVEGVAGPEAANNAGAQTSFIPMLTLGIPSNAIMAVMIGALMIQGIAPGPQVMAQRPELIWGLIASMWVGNIMLVIINLPLVGVWVALLRVPYSILFPSIVLFCCIGAYSVGLSAMDVFLAAAMALLGFLFILFECSAAPLALGFILGPMMEENFRRAMVLSRGDFDVFVKSPLSLGFLIAALALALIIAVPGIRKAREQAFQED